MKERQYEVAVLPLGCTEPHNLHLPHGQDTFEVEVIGDRVCQAACERGAKVVLLPAVPYGTVTNQRACPLSININPSTLNRVVTDIVESLAGHGIRKILLLNGHGGNDMKPLLRELYGRTEAKLFLCNWYRMVGDVYAQVFEHPDEHAGEMETSLALAYWPDLVARRPDGSLAADAGQPNASRFAAVENGWVTITRPWHLLTTNTGFGNPAAASAEKGHKILEIIVQRLAGFLVELSAAEIDAKFPF